MRNLKPEIRYQKSQIAISENLKSTIEKSEIKSLISEMPPVILSSDNRGLSQFAMSLFRISSRKNRPHFPSGAGLRYFNVTSDIVRQGLRLRALGEGQAGAKAALPRISNLLEFRD